MQEWVAGHAKMSADEVLPLIDTNSRDMPVPFGGTR
jgi:hypothetical protein